MITSQPAPDIVLSFPLYQVLALAEHTAAATSFDMRHHHSINAPALLLVVDRGISIMSNSMPISQRPKTVYAHGWPAPRGVEQTRRQLQRRRASVFGGDSQIHILALTTPADDQPALIDLLRTGVEAGHTLFQIHADADSLAMSTAAGTTPHTGTAVPDQPDTDVVAFATLGFRGHHGQGVSLNWTVPVRDLTTARTCLAVAGLPGAMLDAVWSDVAMVDIGREASPVVYVSIPYWTGQRNGHNPTMASERIEPAQRRALACQLRLLATAHGACEISISHGVDQPDRADDVRGVPDNPYRVRMWWD
jgi:hypothetical protein